MNRDTTEINCNAMSLYRVFTAEDDVYAGHMLGLLVDGKVSHLSGVVPYKDMHSIGVAQHYAKAGEQVTVKTGVFVFDIFDLNEIAEYVINRYVRAYTSCFIVPNTMHRTECPIAGILRYIDSKNNAWVEVGL
jgi:hypothetical protein